MGTKDGIMRGPTLSVVTRELAYRVEARLLKSFAGVSLKIILNDEGRENISTSFSRNIILQILESFLFLALTLIILTS